MTRNRQVLTLAFALVIIAFAAALAFSEESAPASKPTRSEKAAPSPAPGTVATVNGSKISEKDLRSAIEAIRRGSPGSYQSPRDDPKLRKLALNQLIAYELLYQDAITLGIKDIDKRANDMLADAERQAGSKEEFKKQLAQEKMTIEQARRNMKKNLLIQAYVEKRIVPRIKVTEKEIQAYYQGNKDRFKHDELVGARHILIAIPKDATEQQKATAQEKISLLRQDLIGGKDFANLARIYSDCPSKDRGGDLGYFSQGTMVPEFEKVAFSLKEGEISEVVQTAHGYHLIQVYGRKPAGTLPLGEVTDQLEKELRGKKTGEAVNARVQSLAKKAKIEILDQKAGGKES